MLGTYKLHRMEQHHIERHPAKAFRSLTGPFDIIGDIHNCADELYKLLAKLGYDPHGSPLSSPDDRTLVFVGDLVDRGPNGPGVLQLALRLIEAKRAIWVKGNHDDKFIRYLLGNPVKLIHGLEATAQQLGALPPEDAAWIRERVLALHRTGQIYPYIVLDAGRLVVSHAGIREDMIGRLTPAIEAFCKYGDVDQKALKAGQLIRRDWAQEYDGDAWVVYGHTVVDAPRIVNKTVNIDTGCVFGGQLTAYRYPEHTTLSMQANKVYAKRSNPSLDP